ncbi:MAG: ferrochelatase [Alphaproteobacteria bacterium]|nr:ferrochelatase [Alphaproteobacteria bacterium]
MSRTAVVVYNLGGPDSPEAVQPFLFNLFNDPLILRQIAPVRWLLAKLISSRRAPIAKEIYAQIGGRSPIREQTQAQIDALEGALKTAGDFKVFMAMRYWHPFADECLDDVIAYQPDEIVLLPLYPQFSTTTTESFLRVWRSHANRKDVKIPTTSICCYPKENGFIETVAELTKASIDAAGGVSANPKVLFSAHGIPKKFVETGDPYQSHIEMTVDAIVEKLAIPDLDTVICYQSRVGPVEWLKPYTDHVISKFAAEGRAIIVVPVAFVSEHSETMVELDIEYRELALKSGASTYVRTPTAGNRDTFIAGLAALVKNSIGVNTVVSAEGSRICDQSCVSCPLG